VDRPYADLHVHSFFSDGSMSPEELVEAAASNGVGALAIADHDALDGSIIARKLCKDIGIHYIPAAEIDTLDGDTNFHVLAYGIDVKNFMFIDFLKHTRFLVDEISAKLIELMQSDYPDFSLADYIEYTYDKCLGGWKALHYLMEKGLTSSLKDGIQFYFKYGMTYRNAGYSTIAATAYRVKAAGGYSVLAHPGETISTSDISQFKKELKRIISFGLDGIECYYPSHSEAVTQACLELCEESDLMITAGSDCHGLFGKTRVGEMDILMDKLRLKDVVANSCSRGF